MDKVTYLTALSFFGREAYVYTAIEKGFFARRGIEVEVQAGAGASENLKQLATGRAQFSANDLSGVLILLGKAGPEDPVREVRTVAVIQQQTLNAIMVPVSSRITAPADLEGARIAVAPGATPELLFPAYAALAGVNPAAVDLAPVQPAQILPVFAARKVDAIAQFVVAKGTVERAVGGPVRVLPYSDYLSDLYGNGLVTTTTLIRNNPDLVARFRAALLDGLVYSIDHPDEAGRIFAKHQPTSDPDIAAAELEAMRPYVTAGGSVGAIDEARMGRALATLQGAGLFGSGLTPDMVMADLPPPDQDR